MAYNTIRIKSYVDNYEEYTATAVAIKPGYLLEMASATTVQAHSTAGGNVLPMFALEDELQGDGITDDYAVSAKINVWIPVRGDVVYARLSDGDSSTGINVVSAGDFLESAGDGTLQKHVADTADSDDAITVNGNQIVGVALEAVDMTDSSAADPSGFIKVRIL